MCRMARLKSISKTSSCNCDPGCGSSAFLSIYSEQGFIQGGLGETFPSARLLHPQYLTINFTPALAIFINKDLVRGVDQVLLSIL